MTTYETLAVAEAHESTCSGKVNRTEDFIIRKSKKGGDLSTIKEMLVGFRADYETAKLVTDALRLQAVTYQF